MAQMVKNLSAMLETWVLSLGRQDPLEKGMATHSSILTWRISGRQDASWGRWSYIGQGFPLGSHIQSTLPPTCHSVSCYGILFSNSVGSDGKESACNAGDPGSIPGLGRFPWRRKWQPTPVFLPGESHGQRSLAGCSPGDHKSPT